MNIRLKDFRLRKNLTQTGLATQLECSQNVISRIEAGTADPKASLLLQIAHFFHVSVDYLLYNSEISQTADTVSSRDSQTLKYYSFYLKFQELNPENQETVLALMEHLTNVQNEKLKQKP